jgi:hypothetical protein
MKTKVVLQDLEGWRENVQLLLSEDQVRLLQWLNDSGYLDENWKPQFLEADKWKEI